MRVGKKKKSEGKWLSRQVQWCPMDGNLGSRDGTRSRNGITGLFSWPQWPAEMGNCLVRYARTGNGGRARSRSRRWRGNGIKRLPPTSPVQHPPIPHLSPLAKRLVTLTFRTTNGITHAGSVECRHHCSHCTITTYSLFVAERMDNAHGHAYTANRDFVNFHVHIVPEPVSIHTDKAHPVTLQYAPRHVPFRPKLFSPSGVPVFSANPAL